MLPPRTPYGCVSCAAFALGVLSSSASAQSMCEVYTVERGDTLAEIADRAGVPGGYQAIFEANRATLSSPNVIEIGTLLRIPCADGAMPLRTAAAQPAREPAPANETLGSSPSGSAPIRFVTGTFPPWSGADLPQQGFFAELIVTALENSGSDLDYTITYVEDWGSHLDVLLPTMAFDMTYPWALPDCSLVENLEPENAKRCTDFDATDPFISAPTGFYALTGGAFEGTTAYPQLLGATLCRPEGHFTFDLEAQRLMPPNANLFQPPDAADCWQALIDGEVDIVTYAVLTADEDIATAGVADRVTKTPLETIQSTHVFVSKDNPRGAEMIEALNEGLAVLRQTGQWFEIVSRHLSDREARLDGG